MAPILPFLFVLSLQLGVSIAIQGIVGAVVMVATVVFKPIVSGLADTFPKSRRAIFVGTVILTCISLCSIAFIPAMAVAPEYSKVWIVNNYENLTSWKNRLELLPSHHDRDPKEPLLGQNNTMFNSATSAHQTWENTFIVLPRNGK